MMNVVTNESASKFFAQKPNETPRIPNGIPLKTTPSASKNVWSIPENEIGHTLAKIETPSVMRPRVNTASAYAMLIYQLQIGTSCKSMMLPTFFAITSANDGFEKLLLTSIIVKSPT